MPQRWFDLASVMPLRWFGAALMMPQWWVNQSLVQQLYSSCTTLSPQSYNALTTDSQRLYNSLTTAVQRSYNSLTTVIQRLFNSCTTPPSGWYFFLEMGKLEFRLFPVRSHAPPNGTDGEISDGGWRQSDGAVGRGECSLSVRQVEWSLGRSVACRKIHGSWQKALA